MNVEVKQRGQSVINDDNRNKERMSSSSSDVVDDNKDDDDERNNAVTAVPRTIGLFGGIAFIVGTVIGSGIFISPKGVAIGSGSVGLSMVNWTICGILSLLGAFCFAELGTVIKQSGGDYTYLYHAYGHAVSFTFSWINNILLKPAGVAAATLTCAQYVMTSIFNDDCGDAPNNIQKMTAIIVLFLLCSINLYSTKFASRIQIIFTVAKLLALLMIIIGGIVRLCQGYTEHLATGFHESESNPGKFAVGLYSGMFAYDGWTTANHMTEEIINPERNLPLAIVIGVPLIIIVYVLTNISYFTVMSVKELIDSPAVAVTWAEIVIPNAAWLLPVFVAISTFGGANGGLCSTGRLLFAAARNEHLPDVLAMVHVKTYTPCPSIILTTIMALIFLLVSNVQSLINFISFVLWFFYGLNMIALIIFRYGAKYKNVHRTIKIPLVIPILVFLASIFLVFVPIITSPQIEFLFAAVFVIVGFLFYIPFVHFRLRFGFTNYMTTFFQLYLQVVKPKDVSVF